jgi:hypothetical protein
MEDKNKTSFILHIDNLCVLDKMTEQQAGILFKAIYFYQKNGTLPELDFAIDMAITPFVNQFKRDEFKYSEFIDKQKQNGSKGGRPRKNTDNETVTKNPQEPNLTQKTQAFFEKPKKAYKDSVSDSVSVSDKGNVINKITNSPYGDGRLHFLCVEYDKENPGKYPKEFYVNFLQYWTAKIQKGVKIGKELWTDEKAFAIGSRLATSYKMTWDKNKTTVGVPVTLAPKIIPQVLELSEEEKYQMRKANGLL